MKKKLSAFLLSLLLFLSAGIFYYEGAPVPVEAKEQQENVSSEVELDEEPQAEAIKEEAKEEQPVGAEKAEQQSGEKEEDGKQKQKSENNDKKRTITIYGETYHLMMDDPTAKSVKAAQSIGADFYAIPQSDVAALVKNGKVIASMSVGAMRILPEYKEFVSNYIQHHKERGIAQNIDLVLNTGAKVHAEFENHSYYLLSLEDGYLIVNYD
ncbi:hypothetical protein [Bacillus mesophilum]|uniref:Uncharacterized protein n=1 Tax=Bacillus mesophilum TaxID=1071718 RepID=A0A7V7RLJ0_9BACI|nr:hypothetical protein [Bacillus mesophilum]KAB2332640.1 hypothetical protein F7732_11145 [Bacillus mesophilum]